MVRPGRGSAALFGVAGVPVGVSICEDVWFAGGPVAEQAAAGASWWSTSTPRPYSPGPPRPSAWPCWPTGSAEAGCAIVYVNQVGGQDELVFDGACLVVGADGARAGGRPPVRRGPARRRRRRPSADPGRTDAGPRRVVRPTGPSRRPAPCAPPRPVAAPLDPVAEVYEALVLGTRDYLAKNGFTDAVIGLSGGIDSSLGGRRGRRRPRAPTTSTAWPCPRATRARARSTDAEALAANLGHRPARGRRSSRPTWPWPTCSPRCSAASPPA